MELVPNIAVDIKNNTNMCFGCGKANPIGLKLQFTWDKKTCTARSEFTPGPDLQGWPGFVHGGISACALDEVIGWASVFAGANNVTAKMQIRYRQMLPINGTYHLSCSIVKQTSRLIETVASITDKNGTVYVEATSVQYVISQREGPEPIKETRAVIWDMDGVIVDTADLHRQSWQYAFKRQGIGFSDSEFQGIFGQRNDSIIHNKMGPDVPPEIISVIAKDKEEFFRETAKNNLKSFPGVVNLLKKLEDQEIKSAIASSAPQENIHLILSGLDIEDYFQAIVFGQEVSESKPSPKIFLKAAEKLGVKPRNCIVVEDAIAGVMAAKRAGMHCIAVTNSHPAENLAEADLIVDSLEKVGLQELEELFKKGE
jgi:beta-phosphoglucomutase family hydrolase